MLYQLSYGPPAHGTAGAAGDRRSAGESRHFTWPSAAAGARGRPVRIDLISNSFPPSTTGAGTHEKRPTRGVRRWGVRDPPERDRGLHGSLPACTAHVTEPELRAPVHGTRRARGAPVHGPIGTGEERTPPRDDPRSPPIGLDRIPMSLHASRSCAGREHLSAPTRSLRTVAVHVRGGPASAGPAPLTRSGPFPDPGQKKIAPPLPGQAGFRRAACTRDATPNQPG